MRTKGSAPPAREEERTTVLIVVEQVPSIIRAGHLDTEDTSFLLVGAANKRETYLVGDVEVLEGLISD